MNRSSIVVGFDGSEPGLHALHVAQAEVVLRGDPSNLIVVSSMIDPMGLGRDDVVDEKKADRFRSYRGEVAEDSSLEIEVREGHPAEVLVDVASTASLLVVGSRGHGGFEKMLIGSIATTCLHLAQRPVMVVPLDARWSPSEKIVVASLATAASYRALAWAVDEAKVRGVELFVVAPWRKPHLWEYESGSPSRYEGLAQTSMDEMIASIDPGGVVVTAQTVEAHRVQALSESSQSAGLIVVGDDVRHGGRWQGHS